jgi:methylenetetrahydrofolate dehydrogenase (NADP+)/methenyltetrahydrofolate cyclohydrolase
MPPGNLIDGRAIAEEIHQETARRVAALNARGVQPCLVFVRVGDDPASRVYVGMKEKTCARLGISSRTHALPGTLPNRTARLARPAQCRRRRCPRHPGAVAAARADLRDPAFMPPSRLEKDVDGFHPLSTLGRLLQGADGRVSPLHAGGHARAADPLRGGDRRGGSGGAGARSNIVGKPMAAILMQKSRHAGATVTLCHSQTRDIAAHCRRADILIAAHGFAGICQGRHGQTRRGGD